jgi:cyclic pyranopterin phosphate synthase
MTPDEIAKVVELVASIGIRKIKLTGGEPLARTDIIEIIEKISPYLNDLSMTTNGILLGKYGELLKKAGLDRINISLDTLDPAIYQQLTGKNYLSKVIEGIDTVKNNGINPIKLNMVIMRDINDGELDNMIRFCNNNNLILQLIELETSKDKEGTEFYKNYHAELNKIETDLTSRAAEIKTRSQHHRKKYFVPINDEQMVEVEMVRPMHNTEFCNFCNRLRLTSDGHLKPCLLSDNNHIDLLTPLRNGASDHELVKLIKTSIGLKEPYWQ